MVMFQVDGAVRMKFMIGAECSTEQEAERLRDDFENALRMVGFNLPNTPHQDERAGER